MLLTCLSKIVHVEIPAAHSIVINMVELNDKKYWEFFTYTYDSDYSPALRTAKFEPLPHSLLEALNKALSFSR